MGDLNELKYAFSKKHLTVAAWCMDGGRAKYTFNEPVDKSRSSGTPVLDKRGRFSKVLT